MHFRNRVETLKISEKAAQKLWRENENKWNKWEYFWVSENEGKRDD